MILLQPIVRVCSCCVIVIALSGCQSGSWWGSKPSATPEDIARYGKAEDNLKKLRDQAEQGKSLSLAEQERLSADLAKKIQYEQDPMMRAQMIRTISVYPTRISSAVLNAARKDPDDLTRIAVCEAWGKRQSAESVTQLEEILKSDMSKDVKVAAVNALGATKQPAAVSALAAGLEDNDPALQYRTMLALREITGKNLGEDIKAWREFVKLPPEQRSTVREAQSFDPFSIFR